MLSILRLGMFSGVVIERQYIHNFKSQSTQQLLPVPEHRTGVSAGPQARVLSEGLQLYFRKCFLIDLDKLRINFHSITMHHKFLSTVQNQ